MMWINDHNYEQIQKVTILIDTFIIKKGIFHFTILYLMQLYLLFSIVLQRFTNKPRSEAFYFKRFYSSFIRSNHTNIIDCL
jgi:hypothetical protein